MRFNAALRLGMAAALVLVLLNCLVATRALQTLFSAETWLAHTLETLRAADDVYLQYSTANSNARAYLLTGDELFARREKDATQGIEQSLQHLKDLTGDNPGQQVRVGLLRSRVQYKLGTLDAAMATRRGRASGQVDPAILSPALADAPDGGISVKTAIAQIVTTEDRLLGQRREDAASARQRVILTIAGASLLDVALLVFALDLLVRAVDRRQQLAARAEEIAVLNRELTGMNTELENRVGQRTLELEAANKELEAFSYSVSHDLRAPLRTIDGFSLALEEDFAATLDEQGRDYIARVRSGVQRMGMLIDALLQLSRVTRSELVRERVDLSQLATNVFQDLRAGDPQREVTWIAQPNVVVDADPRLLRVALENLIGNAWKFTERTAGAEIRFGSRLGEEGTVYFIGDNGAGFDMKYVDRLFIAFQRLHGDRDFKGSGIGLATVSRIILRHHGAIWAEGEPGHGATFFFTLCPPVSPGAVPNPQEETTTV